jgi:hypothetical protein
VLLPATLLLRRYDVVVVIGQAIEQAAVGIAAAVQAATPAPAHHSPEASEPPSAAPVR